MSTKEQLQQEKDMLLATIEAKDARIAQLEKILSMRGTRTPMRTVAEQDTKDITVRCIKGSICSLSFTGTRSEAITWAANHTHSKA